MEQKKFKKINTKKRFVADGVFHAELNEFLSKVLGTEGYAGIEINASSMYTQIRIQAANHKTLLEKQSKRIREIQSLIEKRYGYNQEDSKVIVSVKPINYDRNLCAAFNVEQLKLKLLKSTPVRMAANNVLGTVMRRGGAIGCEVIISGKIRGQRACSQKYTMGYQISTGQPKNDFIDVAIRHVELRQGILGLKVKIMRGVERIQGGKTIVMPDYFKIHEPKEDPLRVKDVQPSVVSAQKRGDEQQEQQ